MSAPNRFVEITNTDALAAAISSGGNATAANQATQITAEQAIQAVLGATNGAAWHTDASQKLFNIGRNASNNVLVFTRNANGTTTTVTPAWVSPRASHRIGVTRSRTRST